MSVLIYYFVVYCLIVNKEEKIEVILCDNCLVVILEIEFFVY